MSADPREFTQQLDCIHKGERYSVRDNGAVLRHARASKRRRPKDGRWTFGNPNAKTGYMAISSERVHRIVATAFHGNPITQQHVVDHVDTNRRNNRPENLRWVTRLENVLLNPITAKRIVYLYGSIEEFIANPSKPLRESLEPNISWMRTVGAEEAQASYQRLLAWSNSGRPSTGGSLGEWLFSPDRRHAQVTQPQETRPILVMAKTPNAAQRDWRVPQYFPCCPDMAGEMWLDTYAANLSPGAVFARDDVKESVVLEVAVCENREKLFVMCEFRGNSVKRWSLARVTYEEGLYIHTSMRTFFEREGAEKALCLAQGLDWTGGDTMDDYC